MPNVLRNATILVVVSTILVGCLSVQDRYERGLERAERGQYEDAIDYFVDVLRKEPAHDAARAELRAAAEAYTADALARARALADAGAFGEAVQVLDRYDRVRAHLARVGERPALPDDYAAFRRRLQVGAVDELMTEADRAARRGDWERALRAYDRALEAYAVLPEQRDAIERGRSAVLVGWAQDEMAHAHYRAAFERAGAFLEAFGPGHPEAAAMRGLQHEALQQGTRTLAFAPFRLDGVSARAVPAGLLEALDDAYAVDHAGEAPLFVQPLHPRDVERAVREIEPGRRPDLSRPVDGRALGRRLDVDLVAVPVVVDVAIDTLDARREQRRVRVGRRDTTIAVEHVRLRTRVETEWWLLDPWGRGTLVDGEARVEREAAFEHAEWAGSTRGLSRELRELVRGETRREQQQALAAELAAALLDQVAGDVYHAALETVE